MERLEQRTVLSVTLGTNFAGINFGENSISAEPPDPYVAVGPNHVVETVNAALRIYNKAGGIISTTPLATFFASLSPIKQSDPVVMYDELVGRFIVGVLDYTNESTPNFFDFAVSNSSDPTGGWSEMYKISVGQGSYFADYPRGGWNADAYFFSFNMFQTTGPGFYDHVQVLTIDKSTVLSGITNGYTSYSTDLASPHATLAPAVMHGAGAGEPAWFVETGTFGGGNSVNVVKMTNALSATPTFTTYTISVAAYTTPPDAVQPGSGTIDTIDTRIFNAAFRDDHLVATHTVGHTADSRAFARWYDFDTSGASPVLYQSGEITPATSTTSTFFPTVEIDINGGIGINYAQSSSTEFWSMYVTGRNATDPLGTMQTPVLAKAGNANYTGSRAGDFSGIAIDPTTGTTFWAANEYKGSNAFWTTWIASFSLGAPTITSNGGGDTASISVPENTTAVTTVTATDPDPGDTKTFSISGGADAAKFNIDSDTGVLIFISAPDFENPTDVGGNNVYDVIVKVTDSTGLFDTQAIAVTVTNVNEEPTITSNGGGATASVSVPENTTLVTTVTAFDPDAGDTKTFSISGGADAAKFSIHSSTGVLTFISAPDFENPTDVGGDNIYDVIVKVTDSGGLFDTQAIAVTVTDVAGPNEAAPVITSNGGGDTASVSVPENTTAVTTVTATDSDPEDTQTFSIAGGADAALFSIDSSTGVLTFNSAPDFENPTDANSDNIYEVTVKVTDSGGLFDTQAISVTVTGVSEYPPTITSNGGGDTASVSVAENTTAVTTVTATDADAGDTKTFSIVGGADAAKFSIHSSSGALTFISAPDFENPADANTDNIYEVTVKVTDSGGLFDTQTISVTVTDANDVPTITDFGPFTINQKSSNGGKAGTIVAADADSGQTLTYSITSDSTGGAYAINASTGVITVADKSKLPARPVGKPITWSGGTLTVQATDDGAGLLSDSKVVSITIHLADKTAAAAMSPTLDTSTFNNIKENNRAGATVGSLKPKAAYTGQKFTFVSISGADAAPFTINARGKITVTNANALDFESKSSYTFQVTVADSLNAGKTTTANVVVNVKDLNEKATFILQDTTPTTVGSLTISKAAVNNGQAIGRVIATDQDAGAAGTVNYMALATSTWLSIDADGTIRVADKAKLKVGVMSVTVSEKDSSGTPMNSKFTFTVIVTA